VLGRPGCVRFAGLQRVLAQQHPAIPGDRPGVPFEFGC
jgi:hypothetical protein